MEPRRALVLDLDYTLLHLEATPRAIEVPGRTRSAYLAAATAEALADLQERHDLFLSTARSWHGTEPVVEGLARRGVDVSGVILEDGALLGPAREHHPLEPGRDWEGLRRALDGAAPEIPPFVWQEDFEACLVARAATPAEAEALLARLREEALRLDPTLRAFRDGRKAYLTGAKADKWTTLEALLGPDRAAGAIGVGDGANDLCWLRRVSLPCTLAGAAPEIVALVQERGGLVSEDGGHGGIAGLLIEIASAPGEKLASSAAP